MQLSELEQTHLRIGEIYREHGVKGFCKTHVFSGTDDNLEIGQEYLLASRDGECIKQRLAEIATVGRYFLLRFESFHAPEQLAPWRKASLWIDKKKLKRGKGEMFDYEWEGFTVIDAAGRELGIVQRVAYTPLRQFVVKDNSLDEDVMIPYSPDWIRKIDKKAKTVVMELPEGLFEL